MSLKNVDIESALRRLADRRIEEAMREGKFDNLSGAGKPLDLEPMPADEGARLTWWMLRILKNSDFTPDEVRYRKRLDHLKDALAAAATERNVVTLVTAYNAMVKQINTMGTNALNVAVAPLSLEAELQRFRERASPGPTVAPAGPAAKGAAAKGAAAKAGASAQAGSPPGRHSAEGGRDCSNPSCRADNPATARFCRRCGRGLGTT